MEYLRITGHGDHRGAVHGVPGGQVGLGRNVVDTHPRCIAESFSDGVVRVLRRHVYTAAQGDAVIGGLAPGGGALWCRFCEFGTGKAGEPVGEGVDKRCALRAIGHRGRKISHRDRLQRHTLEEHTSANNGSEDEKDCEAKTDQNCCAINLWFVRRGCHGEIV